MRVLIGCEESQIVCQSFRKRGHEAYSCDLLPTRGNPDWHIQGDIMSLLGRHSLFWDVILLFPDCTKMAVSGNRWYAGTEDRKAAIKWTVKLWDEATRVCEHVGLENPGSVIFQHIGPKYYFGSYIQYIQPWQFGHGETKKTGLALCGLPKLKPTNIVEGREQRIWRMAPSETRKRDRSETFQGVADAMAEQWGELPCK